LDTTAPTISIESPETNYNYLYQDYNLTLNATTTDSNLNTCWYDYNNTNTTYSCSTGVKVNRELLYELNQNNITVWANDSVGNTNSKFTSWEYILLNTGEEYSTSTFSSNLENFLVNISYDNNTYLGLTANLVWNETNNSASVSVDGGDATISESMGIPTVSAETNVSFYWDIFLDNGIIIENIQTNNITQTVNPLWAINITDLACQAGYFEAVNYTFKNANNFSSLSGDVDYNFQYGTGNFSSNMIYGEFNSISDFRICINATIEDYKFGYGEVQYSTTGYSDRRFYMYENQTLSNSTTREYDLLSLPSADSTSFIFEVKNTFLNPYADKLIGLLRWYPDTNEYKVAEMAKTDTDGRTVMKTKTEDVDYRIGVYEKNGTLIKLADSVRMACLVDPCTYTLKIIHDPQDYYSLYDVESSLTYDDANSRFVYIWNDPEQVTSAMNLEVYKMAGNQDILICNETTSSYTGVMVCSTGNYTGDFYAKVYRSASPFKLLATMYKTLREGVESSFGLFLSALLALATGLIGVFSPVVAVIMLVVGLIPALMFGSINMLIFSAIAAIGGIVIHYIKKSK